MKLALISVYNKTGIIEFAKGLELLNYEIIASGGTYELLKKNHIIRLKKVEQITDFPEIMNGRVKTLHPKIYGGLLADRNNIEHMNHAKENRIGLIDLVVCNLYPFQETVSRAGVTEQEARENIDIGGSAMIRAAAKNCQYVYAVTDPGDYQKVLGSLRADNQKFRKELAQQAFAYTAKYDEAISNYFSGNQNLDLHFKKISELRYGENPHQPAALYRRDDLKTKVHQPAGVINAELLHGKKLSYNNILDADSALALIQEFSQPAAAVIKHTNPCGLAIGPDIASAFIKAYQADSQSAFGGIIVLNRQCNKEIAAKINQVFAEAVLAPDFEPAALKILEQKKNIRLIKLDSLSPLSQLSVKSVKSTDKEYRFIKGGVLEQEEDNHRLLAAALRCVTKKKPTAAIIKDMLFAWPILKHVKSNAVILVKNGVTVGIGAGQMSRVDSVALALIKAGKKSRGAVAASDSFFPFRDSVDKLAKSGVKCIIQQGGSIKDDEVITAANEQGLIMVFTGVRAFKH